jgi:hypothetical protein
MSESLRIQDEMRTLHDACLRKASPDKTGLSGSVIIRYFALKSRFFLQLGVRRLKNAALLLAVFALTSFSFVACSSSGTTRLTTRVLASQSVSSPTGAAGLDVINGQRDTLFSEIQAGSSPGLMAINPNRTTLLAFDAAANNVEVVNTKTQALTGGILLPGPTTSMVALATGSGYAAVPTAPINGSPPGAVEILNLSSGGLTATINVPNAQTVVASPDGTKVLVFANDSDAIAVVSPLLVNTGNPYVTTVSGFDRPAYAVFTPDSTTAYVLNCGPECGGTKASVQALNLAALTLGTPVAVDAATIGLSNGSTLYAVGNSPTNHSCAGQTTAATTCGRLNIVDLTTMTVTSGAVITDGYHDRIDLSNNGQLFIGSHTCTNIGNVNNPTGEVRGCLTIFNTQNSAVIIPPVNGDVTGFQSLTTRDVEYVAEGGILRVYDTTIDSLLLNSYITTGIINITGQIIDVKAIDFF